MSGDLDAVKVAGYLPVTPEIAREAERARQALTAATADRQAGQRAITLADACRLVIAAARPNTPRKDRERMARQMLQRLDGPDPRRAQLLRAAALNLRNDTDGLRRLQAARNVILHTEGNQP